MTGTSPEGRLKLPSTVSMTTILTAVGAIVGLVTTWNHFENRAANNAAYIEIIQGNVVTLRKELRELERNYDRQISHLDTVIAGLQKGYTPIPAFTVPEEKQ